MGQKLIKGYNIQGQAVAHVGTNGMWKIYNAVKQGTGMHVSVFMIEKRTIKKGEKQQTLKIAKKQAMGLMKVRHPGVVAIVQPFTQDQNNMAFVTQRIVGDLNSVIKQNKFKNYVMSQLELRLNFFPVLETLAFLHDTVKQAHLNLNLNSIYITQEGKWKIGGLGYCQSLANDTLQPSSQVNSFNLGSSAPEYVLQNQYNDKTDVFSVGILILNMIYALHGKGQQLSSIKSKQEYQSKKSFFTQLQNHSIVKNSQNSKQLSQMLKKAFLWETIHRSSLQDIASNRWLNDKPILTVKYLQNITNYQNKQQLQFLKGLSGVIHNFHKKVIHSRILPALIQLLKFNHLIASVIYIIIEIMKNQKSITAQQFRKIVWPHIKSVTQGKQMTAQSLYLLVDNVQIFNKYVNIGDIVETIIPLYLKCFDCPQKLKQLALKKTEYLSKKLQYQVFKAKVIPKLVTVMKDSSLDVRKKSLIALRKILPVIDSQTISTHVLTGLQNSRKAGTDGFINAITVSIYGSLAKNLSADIIGTKIVPTLLPYLVDPTVNKSDFLMYKNMMNTMLMKIEQERAKGWRDSDSQKNIQHFTENDFQFQEDTTIKQKKEQGHQQSNYNFLSGYGNQKKPQNQQNSLKDQNSSNFNNISNNVNSQKNQNTGSFEFGLAQQTSQQNNGIIMGMSIKSNNSNISNISNVTNTNNVNNKNDKNQNFNNSPSSNKTIDYDPFASLSNSNPIQMNFNMSNLTNDISSNSANNDMDFGMGFSNNVNNSNNTSLSKGSSNDYNFTGLGSVTSNTSNNISYGNYDFSSLGNSNANNLITQNQNSPGKSKPNLQGPSNNNGNNQNNKSIKPIAKPGQGKNNDLEQISMNFNQSNIIGMNNFNFNTSSTANNKSDPFNFGESSKNTDQYNKMSSGLDSFSFGSSSSNNNNSYGMNMGINNFNMGNMNNSDPFADLQNENNNNFSFQRSGMTNTNLNNQFNFQNTQNNQKKSNNNDDFGGLL